MTETPDGDAAATPDGETPTGSRDDAAVYRRRRTAVGLGLVAFVAAVVATVASTAGGGADRVGSVAATTTSAATTTTTPATTTTATTSTTTTTTTTTSSTTTTTTTTTLPPPTTILDGAGIPVWPPYELAGPLDGVAALLGSPADESITGRPILAVKIDNRPQGRPQWGLDVADVVIEENVEGITRFVALFHSQLPDRAGPVRSARTGDLDLLAGMNRPVLAWSGGNPGVTRWVGSAAAAGVLVDFSAQFNPCYQRTSSRRAPHNLLLDPACAVTTAIEPGPARPLWTFDEAWTPPEGFVVGADTTFDVGMDNLIAGWRWDPELGVYLRSQNGNRHVGVSGAQITASNVVVVRTAHPPSTVDARSPNPITVGFGQATIHRDGLAIEGAWTRASPYDPFVFIDPASGEPIPLDTGRTFVELART
ncbi:DUF3048 domain-containing protein [Ilumatobacter sp.]|uniref:DUF3048 domain-containing protein n=1 Tax=Ilumatobacter sp. TaxID=1967498 RepID=UPI003B51884C